MFGISGVRCSVRCSVRRQLQGGCVRSIRVCGAYSIAGPSEHLYHRVKSSQTCRVSPGWSVFGSHARPAVSGGRAGLGWGRAGAVGRRAAGEARPGTATGDRHRASRLAVTWPHGAGQVCPGCPARSRPASPPSPCPPLPTPTPSHTCIT